MHTHASNKRRLLAVASFGGHWVQLLRITAGMERHCELAYACTHSGCSSMVPGRRFYLTEDFNRWNAHRLVPQLWRMARVLRHERPAAILTTGAAPGLVALLAARLMGIKAIWVDSIANAERLSLCGRIASYLTRYTYTQWPHLAQGRVMYAGDILAERGAAV